MSEDGQPPKGAGIAVLVLLAAFLFVGNIVWGKNKQYAFKWIVSLATKEDVLINHLKPILPTRYANSIKITGLHGYFYLCDGFEVPAEIPSNFTLQGVRMHCTWGTSYFKRMTMQQALATLSLPSRVAVPIFLIILTLMALHVRATDIGKKYRRSFTMESYIKHMAKFHPHLRPLAHLRLDKGNMFEGPIPVKDTYIKFALRHELLRDVTGKVVAVAPVHQCFYFDGAKAEQVFKQQLGARWTAKQDLTPNGETPPLPIWRRVLIKLKLSEHRPALMRFPELKDYEMGLLGVLSAMVCQERPSAIAAIEQMQTTFRARKVGGYSINCQLGRELVAVHWSDKRVQSIVRRHAYVNTLFPAMLVKATIPTEIGVGSGEFCSAKYIWLKPMNRTLFYSMHQVGLREANLEAAGPFLHRQLEEKNDFAMAEVSMDEVVNALRKCLVKEAWLTRKNEFWLGTAYGYSDAKDAKNGQSGGETTAPDLPPSVDTSRPIGGLD